MICPKCDGKRYSLVWQGSFLVTLPCDVCDGHGIVHCCEGERPELPSPKEKPVLK